MVAFAVLSYRFYLVARNIGGFRVFYYCYGFLMLSLSQAAMLASVIYLNPRASLSLYAVSSILTLAGFYSFILGRRAVAEGSGGLEASPLPLAVVWLKSVVSLIDYAAGFIGILVSLYFKGLARYLVLVIAVSYVVRGGMLLSSIATGSEALLAILLVGELARSTAATILSVAYVVPGSGRG
jgi:hypothetical protein